MPSVGPLELAIVLIIALVIFGPKKLPELGSSLGRGMREFKGSLSGEQDDDEGDETESPRGLGAAKRVDAEEVDAEEVDAEGTGTEEIAAEEPARAGTAA